MKLFRTCTLLTLLITFTDVFSIEYPVFNNSGQIGLKESLSAQTLGALHLALFFQMNFSSDKDQIDSVFQVKENTLELDTINPTLTLFSFQPAFSFGVTDFLDIGGFLPINFDIMTNFSPEGGLGNLEFNAKIRVPLREENIFQTALFTSLGLPTGNLGAGFAPRSPWNYKKIDMKDTGVTHEMMGTYSNGKIESSLLALISLCFPKVSLHLNSGVRFTGNPDIDELFILNGGLEFTPIVPLTLFFDFGSTTQYSNVKDGFQINQDHMRCSPGVALRSSSGAMFLLSGDFKLSSNQYKMYYDTDNSSRRISARNESRWSVSFQTGWNGFFKKPDRDHDLVPDKDDKCPEIMEDIDGFEDADGCPDYDNDQDNVPDSTDKCPDIAEDIDGFEDTDGCPDYDNDQDGIADTVDSCMNIPEDKDGFEDADGCPDYDNDRDGVPDSVDKCPMIPEDIDSFQDGDGCPDTDNDLDGVPDSLDKCPESVGKVDLEGCEPSKQIPKEIKYGRVILVGVDFGSGSTTLSNESYTVLDQVFASLEVSPEIILEIQSHSDNSGNALENVKLSLERAKEICDYLIGKGIKSNRLIPVGKGGSEPIADNETILGRKQNTRVEIHRKD